MSLESNKAYVREVMEKGFNQGDLSVIDKSSHPDAVDHQEPPGTAFVPHIKEVIVAMRTAFPDLHFEIHNIIAEDDIVAFRSTMTGTHTGVFKLGQSPAVPPSGRKVSVRHMHFIRAVEGQTIDLWHLWDIPAMMRQMGVMSEPQRTSA